MSKKKPKKVKEIEETPILNPKSNIVEMTKEDLQISQDMTKLALESPMQQDSDLKGVMKEMNDDVLETEAQLPSIDLKTRLHPVEVSSIVIHDAIISLDCLPKECLITTRTKKRLAVSLKGEGRKEMVQIVQGERDKQAGTSFGAKLKGLFTAGGNQNG